jgi:hypothetical protein
MPMGEGWWLNVRSGKTVEVFEHLNAIMTNPRQFGLTSADLAQKPQEPAETHRERILTLVMQKGWIRVRSYRGYNVFEYWKLSRRVADAVFEFMGDTLDAGPLTSLQMNEVASGRSFQAPMQTFYEEVDQNLGGVGRKRLRQGSGQYLYLAGLSIGQGR